MEKTYQDIGFSEGHNWQVMLCPVCKFECNHFSGDYTPYRVPGHDNYLADRVRGDVVYIPMQCESGHYWDLCVGFHKGSAVLFSKTNKYK